MGPSRLPPRLGPFACYSLESRSKGASVDLVDLPYIDAEHESAVRELLFACADEFVPPLSARHSTSQTDLDSDEHHSGAQAYFDEMREQPIVLALSDGELLGFLSYRPDFELDFLGEKSVYVTTVCVEAAHRRFGVASRLYGHIEDLVAPDTISLRTWSTNVAQIGALQKRGYECVRTLVDDRGPGVDTVYFVKRNR